MAQTVINAIFQLNIAMAFLETIVAVIMFTILIVTMFVMVGLEQKNPRRSRGRCPVKSKNMFSSKYTQLKPKENLEEQKKLEEKLVVLAEKLAVKEKLVSRSRTQISETEQKLTGSMISLEKARERQRLEDLKAELEMAEVEISNLQDEIGMINTKRKELQIEMMKQKDVYEEAITSLKTDLKKRETQIGSGKAVDLSGEGLPSEGTEGAADIFRNTEVIRENQSVASV